MSMDIWELTVEEIEELKENQVRRVARQTLLRDLLAILEKDVLNDKEWWGKVKERLCISDTEMHLCTDSALGLIYKSGKEREAKEYARKKAGIS